MLGKLCPVVISAHIFMFRSCLKNFSTASQCLSETSLRKAGPDCLKVFKNSFDTEKKKRYTDYICNKP